MKIEISKPGYTGVTFDLISECCKFTQEVEKYGLKSSSASGIPTILNDVKELHINGMRFRKIEG